MSFDENSYIGIDYGRGSTNIDLETGIRYGVISVNELTQWFWESVEDDYGNPRCPNCLGESIVDYDESKHGEYDSCGSEITEKVCEQCEIYFEECNSYPDEPLSWSIDEDDLVGGKCLDNDLFVFKSPYFTYGPYCSPCVPGAVSLGKSSIGTLPAPRAYCPGKDWFDNDRPCPYPYWSVETGELVYTPANPS